MNYELIIKKMVRWTVTIIPIVISVFLLFKHFAPFGRLKISFDFCSDSPFVSSLKPTQRVSAIIKNNSGCSQKIYADPIYLDLKMPRLFNDALATVVFKNDSESIFKLGALAAPISRIFDFKTLENKILDNLIKKGWDYTQDGEVMLLQRNKKFESIKDFLSNLPTSDKIAVYDYKLDYNYKMESYQKVIKETQVEQSLRGGHTILTYIKDESLDFVFNLKNINPKQMHEAVEVLVFDKDSKIFDNKFNLANDSLQKAPVFISNIKEGVYRIEIRAGDNVIIDGFQTKQKYFVFKKHLNLADLSTDNEESTVFSNTSIVRFLTNLKNSLQIIKVENLQESAKEDISMVETGVFYESSAMPGLKKINFTEGNIDFNGEGLFALAQEQFFNPEFLSISKGVDVDKEGVDYIIARYSPPQELEGGFKTNTVSFDLVKYEILNNTLPLTFSAPDLSAVSDSIEISEIEFVLSKEPWSLNKIIQKITNI